jgi:hypothetical protein
MRIAKLSTDVFADEAAVDAFLTADLPCHSPPGQFLMGKQIAADGLGLGETILFTYRGRLRFLGRSASCRQDNTGARQAEYPYCFVVEPGSIRRADASMAEIEQALAAAGVHVSLAGQGWNRVPDSPAAESAVAELIGGAGDADPVNGP